MSALSQALWVLLLGSLLGLELIGKVPPTLHTPLMSGANAIHGIILVGALIVTAHATNPLLLILSIIAVVLASMNLVGGFVVTDRMLEMFSGKKKAAKK